jgi:flagellar biosynthesis GTPase FlhF
LFCSRELQLGRADLIFPILYIRVAALENDAKRRQNDVLEIIHARQYADWTQLRLRDVASFEFGIKIEQFCRDVCDALHEPWLSPEERRQAEEEQRRKAAEAEAKRFEEERRRQAEEEQRRKGAEAEAKRFEEERRRQAEEEQRRKAEAEAKQLEEERRRQAEEERRRRVAEVEAKRLEEERRRQAATLPKRLQEIKTSLNDFVHFITPFLFVLLGVSFLFSIILFVRVCPETSRGIAKFSEHEAD